MALLHEVGVVQAFFVKEPPEIKPAQAITGWILNTRTIWSDYKPASNVKLF